MKYINLLNNTQSPADLFYGRPMNVVMVILFRKYDSLYYNLVTEDSFGKLRLYSYFEITLAPVFADVEDWILK